MALATTSLNGAVTQSARQIRLTAYTSPATSALDKVFVKVNGEFMLVTDATLSPTLTVARGQWATSAFQHNTLAPVVYGRSQDFTDTVGSPMAAPFYNYGADATITNPVVDAVVYIDKATAAALTLTDPAKDQRNTVTFISNTAAAHTITYATGFYGNTTTSDVATFPATAGATFTIVALNGQWCPLATADDGVTIA